MMEETKSPVMAERADAGMGPKEGTKEFDERVGEVARMWVFVNS